MKNKEQVFQTQYAKTIAGLLGFDYMIPAKAIGEKIDSVTEH